MIDQGVDGICILANYSEQFVLTDEERDLLTELCLKHIAGRVPVIVTCSHFSTQVAAERAKKAALLGAAMVMHMPPYHGATLHAAENQIIEHFAAISDSAQIPIMIQDAPLSGTDMSVGLLVKLAQTIEHVSYFKIEIPFAATKLRELIAKGGANILGPFDGEESITLMADLNAGATGTMSSGLLPELIKPVLSYFNSNDIDKAKAQYEHILPLINFENRQCGLRACKTVMFEGGVIDSDHVRHALTPLHPDIRAELLSLAAERDLIALRWGK
ncbi:UNVERIFIED_CONTAM: hypothetical protein GTU68_002694 [Idotea baltica]|nr:hypothetical protein [Idotea baltica]